MLRIVSVPAPEGGRASLLAGRISAALIGLVPSSIPTRRRTDGTARQPQRGCISRRGARLARRPRARRAAALRRHRRGLCRPSRLGTHAVRRSLCRRLVARGLRGPGGHPVGVADLRGGVLPGRGTPAGDPERHLPVGAHHFRVRHPGTTGSVPPPHGVGRRPVVPGLVRTQRRQRPGGDHLEGGARRGSWRLAVDRPENLDHPGGVLYPPVRAVPHRPRSAAPSWPHLLHGASGRRGHHRARLHPPRRR